jgi:hypothetical protein
MGAEQAIVAEGLSKRFGAEMELSHRADHTLPLYAMVVPFDVPLPAAQP